MYVPRFNALWRADDPLAFDPVPPAPGVGHKVFLIAVPSPSPEFALKPFRLLFPLTVGVGHNCRASIPVRLSRVACDTGQVAFFASLAVGVGNNPEPLTDMRCAEGDSRNTQRPDFVAEGFQISAHLVKSHADETRHILTNNPSGLCERHNAAHLRPEGTLVLAAQSLSGKAEGLAGEASANKVNWLKVFSRHDANVAEARYVRPMLGEYALAPGVDLNLEFNAALSEHSFGGQIKTANARKK
jgi:hypothetical protein